MPTGSLRPEAGALSELDELSAGGLREALAVSDLFQAIFRRDLAGFYPQAQVGPGRPSGPEAGIPTGPRFRLNDDGAGGISVDLFGIRHELHARDGRKFSGLDLAMIRALGTVLNFRFLQMFQISHSTRLELYRGGSEDHYVAAFVEPSVYSPDSTRPSRIASTIHALRTAALSTYENRRVSTGVLLLGEGSAASHPADPDSLTYGVELTGLKSLHRLCDGERTLFLVDPAGKLVEVIDINRWAGDLGMNERPEVPCARGYTAHARATRVGGHVCVVLSPNQEIKLFSGGSQQFAFAHGRWRILDPATKFAAWASAVAEPRLARVLFQAALDLVERRQGGLFVVVDDATSALGRLVAPGDLLDSGPVEPEDVSNPGYPLAKNSLHYLVRGRSVTEIPPPVLEALASLDGAIVTDRTGRLISFGAILRHDASASIGTAAEGARTTAALIASRFGPVLKISEDGIVSCFLGGTKVWDL